MKTTLEKWLLAVGVFLFVWFLVPELDASAAEVYQYNTIDGTTIIHTVDGNVHTFAYSDSTEPILQVDRTGFDYFAVCSVKSTSSLYSFYVICGLDVVFASHSGAKAVNFKGDIFRFNIPGTTVSSDSRHDSYVYLSVNDYIWHFADHDIYTKEGALVFQRPLPTPTPSPQQQFQTAVEMTNLGAVMSQVVGLVPLLIGFLITLISFSKGLQLLSQILRRA